MYLLWNMVVFHCFVSLPEGRSSYEWTQVTKSWRINTQRAESEVKMLLMPDWTQGDEKKSLQEIKMDSWIPYMYIYIYSNIRIYFFVQKGGSVACCPVPPAIICSYSSGSLLEPVILQGWRKVLEATRRSRIQWVIKNRKNMSVNVDVCATRLLPKVEFVARCC